ncbi:hypothetical protein J6590_068947 [Homalodisca vitripennis]|nr:hypothetical protein J6590_068947 [Homalodisca vitripennis]
MGNKGLKVANELSLGELWQEEDPSAVTHRSRRHNRRPCLCYLAITIVTATLEVLFNMLRYARTFNNRIIFLSKVNALTDRQTNKYWALQKIWQLTGRPFDAPLQSSEATEKLRTSCCVGLHLYCFGRLFLRATKRWRKIFIFVHVIISPELEQKGSAAVEDKLVHTGSMTDSSGEIPRLDTIHGRSALLVPGSIADSSREIPRLVTIHRRSALLVPGSMADSSREIARVDTILRRSALLVPGSMAASNREIPRLDTIHRRSALLVPGSVADSSCEIPRLVPFIVIALCWSQDPLPDSSREILVWSAFIVVALCWSWLHC